MKRSVLIKMDPVSRLSINRSLLRHTTWRKNSAKKWGTEQIKKLFNHFTSRGDIFGKIVSDKKSDFIYLSSCLFVYLSSWRLNLRSKSYLSHEEQILHSDPRNRVEFCFHNQSEENSEICWQAYVTLVITASKLWDTVNQRAVRILLECILV